MPTSNINAEQAASKLTVHSFITFDDKPDADATGTAWRLVMYDAATLVPIEAHFERVEYVEIGADTLAYAVVAHINAVDGNKLRLVALLNPFSMVSIGAVTGWMVDGLPGRGPESRSDVRMHLDDIEYCSYLGTELGSLGDMVYEEVIRQQQRRGRLEGVLRQVLELEGPLLVTVVGQD